MVEGKRRDAWDRTSHLLAFIANAQRTKRDKMITAAECNPYLVDDLKRNRPKSRDVKQLARFCGVDVPADRFNHPDIPHDIISEAAEGGLPEILKRESRNGQ